MTYMNKLWRRDVCPACGRAFAPTIYISGVKRQRMVYFIAEHPEGINTRDLMDLIYKNDPDGGATSPQVIPVMVRQANKQLRPQGWEIKPMWVGRGALWQLKEIKHADAKRQPTRRIHNSRVERAQQSSVGSVD
jgi:hypothetical protein